MIRITDITTPLSLKSINNPIFITIQGESNQASTSSTFSGSGENGGGGFRNPNYDSSRQSSEPQQRRRFYYASLSPSEMGVNEPLLFLSPDDQVNNNSTVSPPEEEVYQVDDASQRTQHQQRSGPVFPPESLLPPGWERHEDVMGPYYWHIKSGTIQRDRPTSDQKWDASANPALLIPGSLNPTPLNSSGFRRSQTVSSQLSTSSSFSTNGLTPTKTRNLDSARTDGEVLRREKGQGDSDRPEKRRSWSQFLPEDEARAEDKNSFRFGGVSLGSLSISEENLTPERSSRAVSKVIAELTTLGSGKGMSPPG